jgi:hypothetical protein
MKHSKHGKVNPLRLSLPQTYALSGVVFAGNVAVLVALIAGAADNREALEAVASAAKVAATAEPLRGAPEAPRWAPARLAPGALRLSGPEGWQWQGCRADADGVEVFFAPAGSEKIPEPKF